MNPFSRRALVVGAFVITLASPASGALAASAVSAGPSTVPVIDPPAPRTQADLAQAMRGEALAGASYRLYAEQARREGLPSVARLFDRAADVELGEHFVNEAKLSGLVGTTRDNLTKAITGERYESQTMYPTFAERARAAGDTAAADVFSHNAGDEAGHARSFEQARNQLDN